ncbi:MAG TPA: hypothetical protein VFO89_06150 [Thermoanaerobaculia bacterium]|nr:hypothetical protein [Thermoanaerobaculia bacterium]
MSVDPRVAAERPDALRLQTKERLFRKLIGERSTVIDRSARTRARAFLAKDAGSGEKSTTESRCGRNLDLEAGCDEEGFSRIGDDPRNDVDAVAHSHSGGDAERGIAVENADSGVDAPRTRRFETAPLREHDAVAVDAIEVGWTIGAVPPLLDGDQVLVCVCTTDREVAPRLAFHAVAADTIPEVALELDDDRRRQRGHGDSGDAGAWLADTAVEIELPVRAARHDDAFTRAKIQTCRD